MAQSNLGSAVIYTDGSCHTQLKIGAWASILLIEDNKHILTGTESDTTHNRMELVAVIKAIEYVQENFSAITHLKIYSDSQYVTDLPSKEKKLTARQFITAKGSERQNTDLLKRLLQLIALYATEFIKVKAHKKTNTEINYNREADVLCRQLVRATVKENI